MRFRTPQEAKAKKRRQWWRALRLKVPPLLYDWWLVTNLILDPSYAEARRIVRKVSTDVDWYDETQADWRSAMKGAVGRALSTQANGENFLRMERARDTLPDISRVHRNALVELAYYAYTVRGK